MLFDISIRLFYISIRPRHAKTCLRAYADSEGPDHVFRPMRTVKAQISLRIRAVWSGPLLSATRIVGYYGMYMYQWRAKARVISCACAGWCESVWGWPDGAKVSCILCHRGVQLILAYSWARPAVLVVGKGRWGMFFISSVSSLSFLFLFLPCPSLCLQLHRSWRGILLLGLFVRPSVRPFVTLFDA